MPSTGAVAAAGAQLREAALPTAGLLVVGCGFASGVVVPCAVVVAAAGAELQEAALPAARGA